MEEVERIVVTGIRGRGNETLKEEKGDVSDCHYFAILTGVVARARKQQMKIVSAALAHHKHSTSGHAGSK